MIKIYELMQVNSDNQNLAQSHYESEIYDTLACPSTWEGICHICTLEHSDRDIIGIVSGGKYFLNYDIAVGRDYLNRVFEEYDVVLPYEGQVAEASLASQFIALGGSEELLVSIRNYIESECQEYLAAYDSVMDGNVIFPEGQIICRFGLLKDYVAWVGKINMVGTLGWDIISGWLIKVFLLMTENRVLSVASEYKNPTIWNNSIAKIELTKQYFDLRLGELIELRKQTGFDAESSLIDEVSIDDDFEGKYPVWICWWQGEDQMPEMVRACVDSIRRNLPANATIRFITLENCGEYVTFTPTIIDKFNAGIITYTHLSDILRAELLYRYGGMWIDATYFVSSAIPEDIFEIEGIYSLAFNPPLWDLDLQRGRWTLSLLISKPYNPAMQFLTEALWIYWENEDKLVDYFTVDYCLDAGYRAFECIKVQVDAITPSAPAVYDLQLRMNQRFNSLDALLVGSESRFYKLNRRNEYHIYTEDGALTNYGAMCSLAGIVDAPLVGKTVVSFECHEEHECVSATNGDDIYVICRDKFDSYASQGGLAGLMADIRMKNPTRIVDDGCNLARYGLISRYMLEDIVRRETVLVGTGVSKSELFPLHRAMYDELEWQNEGINS